jgi:hypothetical protein
MLRYANTDRLGSFTSSCGVGEVRSASNCCHYIAAQPLVEMCQKLTGSDRINPPDRIVCVVLLNVGELQTHVARCGDDDSAPETR